MRDNPPPHDQPARSGVVHALVIDDDDVDREHLARMMGRLPQDITLVEAASGAEALALLQRRAEHFDVVFLDFKLEDCDGRDLLPRIRDRLDPDCPIIAITGFSDEQVAVGAIKLGMAEFLPKRGLSAERLAASIDEGFVWRDLQREQRRIATELTHRGFHDPLTHLPNRALLADRLNAQIARTRRTGEPFAVVMIDLDRFKSVNDRFGHGAGDAVLATTAGRLRGCLREVDTVARLGGDEFVLLLHNVRSEREALIVARKVIHQIEQPVAYGDSALLVGASLGIALCPELGLSADGLLRAADEAMYLAKRGASKAVVSHDHCAAPAPQSRDQSVAKASTGSAIIVSAPASSLRRSAPASGVKRSAK
jgi:diguanylate cyclase (GGDEF)-like protein